MQTPGWTFSRNLETFINLGSEIEPKWTGEIKDIAPEYMQAIQGILLLIITPGR